MESRAAIANLQVPAAYVQALAELIRSLGADTSDWLAMSGLTMARLEEPDASVSLPLFAQLAFDAVGITREPALGLLLGDRMHAASHGIVGFAVSNAGTPRQAVELLARAEALAQQIAGPWKVTELARIAAAWRDCADVTRAAARLAEAAVFLKTLPALERAEEALALAQGWALAGESGEEKAQARAFVTAVLAEADREGNPETWRKPRVRALLALAELSGK